MLKNKVIQIVQSLAPVQRSQIDDACNLVNDLGFNSFKLVELIVAIEDAFNISFDEDYLVFEYFITPRSIIELLEKLDSKGEIQIDETSL